MIFVDTSVVLAHIFSQDTRPGEDFWAEDLVASRLLEYEVFNRLNAQSADEQLLSTGREVVSRFALLELAPNVLARALSPFPQPVRTLDALHLASADYLRGRGLQFCLATYDQRMARAAEGMGFELAPM